MKRLPWIAAVGLIAAGAAATVASAATLGGVSGGDLDTATASVTPAFALADHFASPTSVPLNGTPLQLSPTGAEADLAYANAPSWTASSEWVESGHVAQASGSGTTPKVAYFPFTAQNGYVSAVFDVFSANASAGLLATYDPVAQSGVALIVRRSGGSWSLAIGTLAAGAFSASSSAVLPLALVDRPTGAEIKVRIVAGTAIGSYGGVDYVSRATTSGTAAGLVTLTPNVAVAYHSVAAAKTP